MAFKPGQSGNPGGRKPLTSEAREAKRYLQSKSLAASQKLVDIMETTDNEALAARIAKDVIELGIGKAGPQIDVDGEMFQHIEYLPREEQVRLLAQRMAQYQLAIQTLKQEAS